MGVSVEAGILKPGTPICVPSKEFVFLGQVSSIEINNKPVDSARRGQEVCIKIENVPGDTPKLFGRHFDDTDMLMSRISRDSIDAVKNYFRDDMTKQDWGLMVELKKLFQILMRAGFGLEDSCHGQTLLTRLTLVPDQIETYPDSIIIELKQMVTNIDGLYTLVNSLPK
ncbi:IF2P-like protein [Mya arenaria]|uniref:IF2P-like protein n=1 Tax=Mya arenaria TaxID=6604 RepID=A0ABY7DK87_MYAAR|nr:IF2P-like protein [Mya arenaria]